MHYIVDRASGNLFLLQESRQFLDINNNRLGQEMRKESSSSTSGEADIFQKINALLDNKMEKVMDFGSLLDGRTSGSTDLAGPRAGSASSFR